MNAEGNNVFVSYAAPDKEFADLVVKNLKAAGVDPWYLPLDEPEPALKSKIEGKIKDETRAWIIILSPHTMLSRWVGAELGLFTEGNFNRMSVLTILHECSLEALDGAYRFRLEAIPNSHGLLGRLEYASQLALGGNFDTVAGIVGKARARFEQLHDICIEPEIAELAYALRHAKLELHTAFTTENFDELLCEVLLDLREKIGMKNIKIRARFRDLRHRQRVDLGHAEVQYMLRRMSFPCQKLDHQTWWNNIWGKGVINNLTRETLHGQDVVTDRATGLMWQAESSREPMEWTKASDGASIAYAGFEDWRLATLEELMSLMRPVEVKGENANSAFIDPLFSLHEWSDPKSQHVNESKSIWSSDRYRDGVHWVASFGHGHCDAVWEPMYALYVRNIGFESVGFFEM